MTRSCSKASNARNCPLLVPCSTLLKKEEEEETTNDWLMTNDWCIWTVVLEKTLESPFDCKEIQPVHPKGNQSWIFIGRTDAEAETPNTLATWCKEWTHWKRPWCWERLKMGGEGTTEDELVGWYHRLNGRGFEQAPVVGDGQGSLVCCSPWGCKESDMPEWLNWTDWMTGYRNCDLENRGSHNPEFMTLHTAVPIMLLVKEIAPHLLRMDT